MLFRKEEAGRGKKSQNGLLSSANKNVDKHGVGKFTENA